MTKLAKTEKNLHLFFKRAQKSQRKAGYLCHSLDFQIHPGKNETRGILRLTAGDALQFSGTRRVASWAGCRADLPVPADVSARGERDASRFNVVDFITETAKKKPAPGKRRGSNRRRETTTKREP